MKLLWVLILSYSSISLAQVSGDLSTQYYENISPKPNPGIQITPDLKYKLDSKDSFMALIPYRSTTGWDDTTLSYILDINKHVEPYFEFIAPTSLKSQRDSMYGGLSANLRLQADLGHLNVKFDNGLLGWDYHYTTQLDGDYNSAFALTDKLWLAYRLVNGLDMISTLHLWTYQDFDGQTDNIYRASLGFRYKLSESFSLDAFYSYKNGHLNDIYELQGGSWQEHAGLAWHF